MSHSTLWEEKTLSFLLWSRVGKKVVSKFILYKHLF